MEGDPTNESPVAEATVAEAALPVEESASAPLREAEPDSNAVMNAVLRGHPMPASTSKPADEAARPDAADATAGESAPSGDVKPADAPAPGAAVPRRGVPKAVADLQEENERLKAERDPAKIREQVLADLKREQEEAALSQQAEADAARYRRLLETPDAELSAEDYQWREEQKDLLARYPKVRELYTGLLAEERKALTADLDGRQAAFWTDVRSQIASKASLPHVDAAVLKTAPTWDQMAEHFHAAGAAWVRESEVAPLRDEVEKLRDEVAALRVTGPRGLGSERVPASGGRSGGGPSRSENDVLNSILRSAATGGRR